VTTRAGRLIFVVAGAAGLRLDCSSRPPWLDWLGWHPVALGPAGTKQRERAAEQLGGRVSGHERRALFRRRLPGAAGVSAQRVVSGLAVQVAGVGFDQVVHDDRVHGGLLKGGK
jgi:hypothetical protein